MIESKKKHEEATKTLEQENWKMWNMRGSEMGNKSCRSDILIMDFLFLHLQCDK